MLELLIYPILGAAGERIIDPKAQGAAIMAISQTQFAELMETKKKITPDGKGGRTKGGGQPKKPAGGARTAQSLATDPLPRPEPPTPTSTPTPKVKPEKVTPSAALRLAPHIKADILKKGEKYARKAMRAFQKAAGLKMDGLYGPRTAGALAFFLGDKQYKTTPPAFKRYRGKSGKPFVPYTVK